MGHKNKHTLSESFMILMHCAYFLWQTSYGKVTAGCLRALLFYAGYQWELLWSSLEYDLEIFAVNYLKH